MAQPAKKTKHERRICLCNDVTQERIENAITQGCDTLGKLFDSTTAGVGACGGTCQPTLRKMLDTYKATGKFPENPRPPDARLRKLRSTKS